MARAAAGEEILSFTLDGDVYAAVREGFPDIRILDRQGGSEVLQLCWSRSRSDDPGWSAGLARLTRLRCARRTARGSRSSSAWPRTPQTPAA